MQVTETMFDQLATLSCLHFSPEEKAGLMKELDKMIGFVQKLREVDTTGVEPLWYMGGNVDVLRDDEVGEMLDATDALKNANNKTKEYFLVPKVIQKS